VHGVKKEMLTADMQLRVTTAAAAPTANVAPTVAVAAASVAGPSPGPSNAAASVVSDNGNGGPTAAATVGNNHHGVMDLAHHSDSSN